MKPAPKRAKQKKLYACPKSIVDRVDRACSTESKPKKLYTCPKNMVDRACSKERRQKKVVCMSEKLGR